LTTARRLLHKFYKSEIRIEWLTCKYVEMFQTKELGNAVAAILHTHEGDSNYVTFVSTRGTLQNFRILEDKWEMEVKKGKKVETVEMREGKDIELQFQCDLNLEELDYLTTAVAPSAKEIIVGDLQGSISFFDREEEKFVLRNSITIHEGPVAGLRCRGSSLVSIGMDGHVKMMNTKGELKSSIWLSDSCALTDILILEDDTILVSCADGVIRTINFNDKQNPVGVLKLLGQPPRLDAEGNPIQPLASEKSKLDPSIVAKSAISGAVRCMCFNSEHDIDLLYYATDKKIQAYNFKTKMMENSVHYFKHSEIVTSMFMMKGEPPKDGEKEKVDTLVSVGQKKICFWRHPWGFMKSIRVETPASAIKSINGLVLSTHLSGDVRIAKAKTLNTVLDITEKKKQEEAEAEENRRKLEEEMKKKSKKKGKKGKKKK